MFVKVYLIKTLEFLEARKAKTGSPGEFDVEIGVQKPVLQPALPVPVK